MSDEPIRHFDFTKAGDPATFEPINSEHQHYLSDADVRALIAAGIEDRQKFRDSIEAALKRVRSGEIDVDEALEAILDLCDER